MNTFILGALLCSAIYFYQKTSFSKTFRGFSIIFFLVLFFLACVFIQTPVFMGNNRWWEASPWIDLIYIFWMLLGMVAKVINSAILVRKKEKAKLSKNSRAKIKLKIDKWDFVQPLFLSLATYSVLKSQIGSKTPNMAAFTICFQNGFWWQSLIGHRNSSNELH